MVGSTNVRRPDDVVVDRPGKKSLFVECEWRHWMSAGSPTGQGDFESRAKNFKFNKKSTCGLDRTKALYIDARRDIRVGRTSGILSPPQAGIQIWIPLVGGEGYLIQSSTLAT